MRAKGIDVRVVDTPFDPSARPGERVVEFRKQKERPLYRVYLRLEGPELNLVKAVTYRLHETFDPRAIRVARTTDNPSCTAQIWTWGVFQLTADVEDIRGRRESIAHDLQYDKFFEPVRFREERLALRAV